MDVKIVACSEARATFTVLTTVAKKAGSGAAGEEKEEPARGVNTGGTTGTTELNRHVRRQRINAQGFWSQRRVAKKASRHAVVCLAWSSHKYQQANINDLKGQQASKQKRTRCPC